MTDTIKRVLKVVSVFIFLLTFNASAGLWPWEIDFHNPDPLSIAFSVGLTVTAVGFAVGAAPLVLALVPPMMGLAPVILPAALAASMIAAGGVALVLGGVTMCVAQDQYDMDHCPGCEDLAVAPIEIDDERGLAQDTEPSIISDLAEGQIIQIASAPPRSLPSYERQSVTPFSAGWGTGGLVENRVETTNKKLNVSDLEYYSGVARNNKEKKETVYVRCLHAPKAISA